MGLKEFLKDIDDSVSTVNSSDFDIEIIDDDMELFISTVRNNLSFLIPRLY